MPEAGQQLLYLICSSSETGGMREVFLDERIRLCQKQFLKILSYTVILWRKKLPYLKRGILGIFRLLPLCLIFLPVSTIFSQYRIDNWSNEQGLPHKTVRSVLQTRDGYIWAATSDGLARFDGVRFTVFNTANSGGLKSNRLASLAETADGSLWISSETSGLFRFRGGEFSSVSIVDGLPSDVIFSIRAERAANRLTILTSKGIAVWQDEKIVSVELLPEPPTPYAWMFDNTGAFCVKENGVVRRRTGGGEIVEYKLPEDLPDTILTRVYVDRTGAVWIAVFHRPSPGKAKLYVFKNNQVSVFTERDGLPNAALHQILEDSWGGVWMALGRFEEGGLVKFENGKFRPFTKEDGFYGLGVFGLTEDREGGIWAAVSDNGLARITPRFITSLTSDNGGLSSDNVYPLYEDPDGVIWSGAWRVGKERNGGIDRLENGIFKHFAGVNEIASLSATALFKDREGVLWIGALGSLTSYENGKFTKYLKENNSPHATVSAITQTRDGTIWFATEEGLKSLRAGEITQFTTTDGLPHNDTRNLHEARDGTLWIATMGGLVSFREGKFTNHTQFPPIQVRSIYEDADGALWFGTYDEGIFRYKNDAFKKITIKDGLFDQGAFQILEDDFGRFWISSNRGVYRVNRQQLNDFADGRIAFVTSVAYGVKDGMADVECNGGRSPAGFKSKKDGTLWFPTQKGIVVIAPKALPVNTEPPNVVIESCLLDGEETACDAVKILPENDSLEIKYTALSFNKPEQIKFKYKLEGLDENWVDAGTRRRAYFTHLPPGEYSFKVSAANVDGVWNETGANLKISVTPPFYRTLWFLALCAIFVSGLIGFIFNLQVKNLKKRHAAQEEFSRLLLESQERERQRIAAELHDSLGQNLLVIKNWSSIGLKNPADLKTEKQFSEISETVSDAIEEVREIAYNLRPFQLDRLGLSKAIESMLERVFDSSAINFTMQIDNLEGFFPKEAEIAFYRIVQEAVNNVVKHSEATEAGVSVRRLENELRLLIWDNGKGFDRNLTSPKHGGFGLTGISERARILGGKISVDSTKGEGTNLTFVINPIGKNI
jgi:signal transduction histidine kinase/ligand-binding sensor domain-containing protein